MSAEGHSRCGRAFMMSAHLWKWTLAEADINSAWSAPTGRSGIYSPWRNTPTVKKCLTSLPA
jgi:hypothetical protein